MALAMIKARGTNDGGAARVDAGGGGIPSEAGEMMGYIRLGSMPRRMRAVSSQFKTCVHCSISIIRN